ncbi:response regulator [Paenibacillus sp. YN15]|uniref:response regulator n=1 Tax=Paenibacillus sp. YN15 TaxID=1742774 RepID=UPI0015EC6A93|nr:response regulator [Paenibacillus sp. YN15]
MMRAMLVDDDVPMIKYLRTLIPWEQYGVKIVASAQSGVKALQLFRETRPQLVITDIGMPKMDGIELANHLRSIDGDVRIIFLTCHEDFHYARKAVQLNADDYLIKDELTAEALARSEEKAVKTAGQVQKGSDQTNYREEIDRNRDLLKRSFWKQIVSGDCSQVALGLGQRLGSDWSLPYFMLGMLHLDYASFIRRYGCKDQPLIQYALYNIAKEQASLHQDLTVFAEDGPNLYFVMNYQRNLAFNPHEAFRQFATDMRVKALEYLSVETCFVSGSGFWGIDRIAKELGELKQFNMSLFYEEAVCCSMSYIEPPVFYIAQDSKDMRYKEALLQACREKSEEGLSRIIEEMGRGVAADRSFRQA